VAAGRRGVAALRAAVELLYRDGIDRSFPLSMLYVSLEQKMAPVLERPRTRAEAVAA
jgi:hypothetical protein